MKVAIVLAGSALAVAIVALVLAAIAFDRTERDDDRVGRHAGWHPMGGLATAPHGMRCMRVGPPSNEQGGMRCTMIAGFGGGMEMSKGGMMMPPGGMTGEE